MNLHNQQIAFAQALSELKKIWGYLKPDVLYCQLVQLNASFQVVPCHRPSHFLLRQAEAANEAHIAAFEALGEMVPSGSGPGHGGVGPGPRVIPPKFSGAPPPPPPPPAGPVPEPAGPPPPSVIHARDDPSNPNNRLKTGWKNRMCALITAIDMNLTDRVSSLCDLFLDKNKD